LCRLVHHTSAESVEDKKPSTTVAAMPSNVNRKLLFSNLSYKTTETTLINYFSSFGPIEELVLYKDDQDQSLRRGFLIYKDVNHVDQAMSRRPHCLDSRPVHLQRAIPSPYRNNYQNPSEQLGLNLAVNEIFISRLGSGETRELFVNYFKSFGNIIDCRVFNSHAHNPQRTGYAFVRFADYDCVDRIILARPHVINSKFYHIRKCIPREYNYIVSSVKPISQSRPIWRHFAFGLINTKTQEITYPSLSTPQCAQQSSSSSGFTWVDPPALTVCVDRTVGSKVSTNDFEVITTNSPSSSSISLINSTDDFTPLASPLYSTAIAYSPTPIDHEDRKLYELI